eukprot:155468_1
MIGLLIHLLIKYTNNTIICQVIPMITHKPKANDGLTKYNIIKYNNKTNIIINNIHEKCNQYYYSNNYYHICIRFKPPNIILSVNNTINKYKIVRNSQQFYLHYYLHQKKNTSL